MEVTVDHQSGEPWTKQWVIVCTPTYIALDSDSSQPVQPARMLFHANGAYTFEVLLQTMKKGLWKSSEPLHSETKSLLDTLLAKSGYVVCSGIHNYEATFQDHVRFESNNLRVWNPLHRYDSHNCLLWHILIAGGITMPDSSVTMFVVAAGCCSKTCLR